MVLIGVCGPSHSGKNTVLEYLEDKLSFNIISKEKINLEYVTRNWQRNMAFRIDNPIEQIPKFKKRPFFVSLGVESPLNLRMKRVEHNANNILNDETPWGSILSSCQVIVVNNGSLEDLWTCIDSIDILDPKWIRPPWDSYFMQLAELASHRSNCMKRRVGAVLVKNSIIMATGYNGTPRYYPNCLDGYCARCNDADVKCGQKLDECFCLHAEENALLEAGRDRANGGTIYCNTCPCIGCAKKIAQVGIKRVVYSVSYGMDSLTKEFFRAVNIELLQHEVQLNYPKTFYSKPLYNSTYREYF